MILILIYIFILFLYFLVFIFFAYTLYACVKGAPFVPTNKKNVKTMLELAELSPNDILMDLGSGDGRILKMAAPKCQKCIGVEINPLLYWWSRLKLCKFKNIEIKRKDLWLEDLSAVNVLTLFFIHPKMGRLKEKIYREMKQGTKVVSCGFQFPDWQPTAISGKIYLYKLGD